VVAEVDKIALPIVIIQVDIETVDCNDRGKESSDDSGGPHFEWCEVVKTSDEDKMLKCKE
jgi:hypothetical protein